MSNQSRISDDVSHAYFTSKEDAQFVADALDEIGWLGKGISVLEPSCGDKSLILPFSSKDLKILAADLIDYGVGAEIQDYLESDYGRFDLVLTNPPFGKMATLAVKFFNKAATNSDRIAFIVPQSFRKISIIDRLNKDYWPVFDSDLPSQEYKLPDGSVRKVKTCVQFWEKRAKSRPRLADIDYTSFFTPLTKEEALTTQGAYAIRGQGSSAGKILEGLDYSPASTRFLLGSKKELQNLDLARVAGFTAGIPSIGYAELAYALSLDDPSDFLRRGVVALLM